jgi:alkanesulfonate monooxygenase
LVLAKMASQIEHIARGRFGIDLVNAWNKPEYEKAGIAFAEHDERYAYGREWLAVVDALLRGERVTFSGRYFRISDYQLRPKDHFRARPCEQAARPNRKMRHHGRSSRQVAHACRTDPQQALWF